MLLQINKLGYVLLSGFLLFLSTLSLNAAEIPKGVEEHLKTWQPTALSMSDEGILEVTLDEKKITETIFSSVITNGVCATVWLKEIGGDLAGVKQVHLLNKNKAQGLVFNGGKEACDEKGKMPRDESDKYLKELTFPYGEQPEIAAESQNVESKFDCNKKNCGQMSSCEEAKYKLEVCGHTRLDRDKNGIPCEKICY